MAGMQECTQPPHCVPLQRPPQPNCAIPLIHPRSCRIACSKSEQPLFLLRVRFLPLQADRVEHLPLPWVPIFLRAEGVGVEVRHNCRHADARPSSLVMSCKRKPIRVPTSCGHVMRLQNGRQRRGGEEHFGQCCLQDGGLEHVGPEKSHSMCGCSQVRSVDEYWRSQKRLHQVIGLLHCSCASLIRVCVLQQVHECG